MNNQIQRPSRYVSQQTIAWLQDLYKRNLLEMNPPYQRRSVWNLAYRQYFIETILLRYPSPAIFLYREISEETGVEQYSVVDGKQRLETIFQFANGDFPLNEKSGISNLQGKVFGELDSYRSTFWSYTMTIEYIPSVEEGILNDIFDRINRNTRRLTNQELRHARFDGIFISLAERLASHLETDSPELPRIVPASRRQMKDVEFVAELLLLLERGVRGSSVADLDEAFSIRDSEWDDAEEIENRFMRAYGTLKDLLSLGNLRKTRMRNQADYYSLFGAVDELLEGQELPGLDEVADRLAQFTSHVEVDEARALDPVAAEYYTAARSASNDLGVRKRRIEILKRVLTG